MTAREGPQIVLATLRVTEEGTDIECRFSDGQKYAPINVTEGDDELAQDICDWLNTPGTETGAGGSTMTARERGFWAGLYLACGVALSAAAILQDGNEWHPFFGAILFVLALYHWNREATP